VFCYQCEQTKDGTGCTAYGVCGKDPISAALQDLLLHAAKGVSMYAYRARRHGVRDESVDRFVIEALFTTVTNVNFDVDRLEGLVRHASDVRDRSRVLYEDAAREAGQEPEILSGPAMWSPAEGPEALLAQQVDVGVTHE